MTRLGRPIARAFLLAIALAGPSAARAQTAELAATVGRIDAFMQRHEVDGVTRETRVLPNETEEIRLSVVPQLLAYHELWRAAGGHGHEEDIVARADFLVVHQPAITTNTAFDGMLGYALLGAWEATGRAEYRDAALPIVLRCLTLTGNQLTLNWGLMGAMTLARWHRLTGDAAATLKVDATLRTLPGWQNGDGSFPHYCAGTRDMHYTSWMTQELLLVRAEMAHGLIDVLVSRALPFLEHNVDVAGEPQYGWFCTKRTGCALVYWSRGAGCNDYDTRGWINELGYLAYALEGRPAGVQERVLGYLAALEGEGAWRDKWRYPPEAYDPIYVWASGDPSVIRTSVVFWSLAALLGRRTGAPVAALPAPHGSDFGSADPGLGADLAAFAPADPVSPFLDGRRLARLATAGGPGEGGAATDGDGPAPLEVEALRSRADGGVELRFVAPRAGAARLSIHDVAGRRIAVVESPAGEASGVFRWDGRDAAGAPVRPGIYFARLSCGDARATARIAVLR
jgi:hypothetical protein